MIVHAQRQFDEIRLRHAAQACRPRRWRSLPQPYVYRVTDRTTGETGTVLGTSTADAVAQWQKHHRFSQTQDLDVIQRSGCA